MKTYTKTITTTEPRLEISHDYDPVSPRLDTNLGYFITVDSSMKSPDEHELLETIVKEAGRISRNQEDHMKRIIKQYNLEANEKIIAIYPITKHEYGAVNYSIGNKHGFDYSNNGFYIITDKTQSEVGTDKKDFETVINGELDMYNSYVNGEVLCFTLYDDNGEFVDGSTGYYDIDDIKENLPAEWKDEALEQYIINN